MLIHNLRMRQELSVLQVLNMDGQGALPDDDWQILAFEGQSIGHLLADRSQILIC